MHEMSPAIADFYSMSAEKEIKKSRLPGSKQMSWNELRASMLESLDEKVPPPAGEDVRMPLEMASLRLMIKAGADKRVQFTRKADSFTLVVPLSDQDADEAIATIDLARKTIAERLEAGKKVDKTVVAFLAATDLGRGGSGLSVTLNLGKLAESLNADHSTMPKPDGGQESMYERTAACIERQGIAVSKSDQFSKIVQRFLRKGDKP